MGYTNSHLTFDISNSIFTQDCLSESFLIRPVVIVIIAYSVTCGGIIRS